MLSAKNKEDVLRLALVSEYKIGVVSPIPKELKVEEVYDDQVIYNVDGQLYQSDYSLDDKGVASFGEPHKVLSTNKLSNGIFYSFLFQIDYC